MKHLLLLLVVTCTTQLCAQDVSYTVKHDDPSSPAKVIINLEYLHVELPFHSLSAINDMSFNIGLFATIDPIERIGADLGFRRSVLTLGQISDETFPVRTEWWAGGHLFLSDKTKVKKQKVGLDSKVKDNYSTNTHTTTETYMMVDGKTRRLLGFRGGVFRKSTPRSLDDEVNNGLSYEFTRQNATGLYFGLLRRNLTNLVVDTDAYGLVSTASHGVDVYLDVLILAGNNFVNPLNNSDVNDPIKSMISRGFPVGGRFGMNVFQIAPKAETGKNFGFAASLEVGHMPYAGFYVGTSLAATIIKK